MLAYDRRMRRFNLEVILYALITLVLFIGDLRKSNRHHGNLSWFFSSLADIVALDLFPIVPVPGSIESGSGASPIICPRLEPTLAVVTRMPSETRRPQARAEYCRLPSAPARYTLGQAAEDAASQELNTGSLYGRDLYASHLD